MSQSFELASNDRFAVDIEAARGCPNHCSYCNWGKTSQYRIFPVTRIVQELRWAFDNLSVFQVFLLDYDAFAIKSRAVRILSAIHANNRRAIPTFMCVGPQSLDLHLCRLASDVPGLMLSVGIQSTDQLVLHAICRPPLDPSIKERLKFVRRHEPNLNLSYDLIIGLPEQSLGSFRQSVSDVLDLLPSGLNTHTLQVLPDSPLWHNAKMLGIVWESAPPHRVVQTPWMSEKELAMAKRLAMCMEIVVRDKFLRNTAFHIGGGC